MPSALRRAAGTRRGLREAQRAGTLFFLPAAALTLSLEAFGASPVPQAPLAQARAFFERAEKRLEQLQIQAGRAAWVHNNFITYDTEKIAAESQNTLTSAIAELAAEARSFEGLDLPLDLSRKLRLLKLSVAAPAPPDPKEQKELTEIGVWMESLYGKGQYCPDGKKASCKSLQELEKILAESRNPQELLEVWIGWRKISPPMRPRYKRFVELSNKGAQALGFSDTGVLWRSGYDMSPEAFSAELERLWRQVQPLYEALHSYVRRRLTEHYGAQVVGKSGRIPAHLLGNMWAQSWGNIYSLVAPSEQSTSLNLTERLKAKGFDEGKMVRTGEGFFTSLGLKPLPKTFWERSLFLKPKDREVVCHASAWDVESPQDLRIKMCIEVNEEDFTTIHHELGHNFYQRAYGDQPILLRGSANDGFHEALGDTIALSVTPQYLHQIGLLEEVPAPEQDLELLMRRALDKVAFLPFGLLMDQWRWKVFSGRIRPGEYNRTWWELREAYQKVVEPVARSEKDFDPGAKYHIPANVPYARYFLAHILQFQFFRELCREAGHRGPLHRCSFYGNKKVGKKLQRMMEMGASRPWPQALQTLTGEKEMDATAILDYFAPLKTWLDQQNKSRP